MATPKQHVAEAKRNLKASAHDFMSRVMTEARNITIRKLTGEVLFRRTGRLASSITTRVKQSRGRTSGDIGTNVWYGVMWETTGHKAYDVRAIRARALIIPIGSAINYTGAKAGTPRAQHIKGMKTRVRRGLIVFRKSAHIPAAPARPFIFPALKETMPFMKALHVTHFKRSIPKTPIQVTIKAGKNAR